MEIATYTVKDCRTCKFYKKIINFHCTHNEYGGQSCKCIKEDGFGCLGFANKGIVMHKTSDYKNIYNPCRMYITKY